jgi:hypothetical protein
MWGLFPLVMRVPLGSWRLVEHMADCVDAHLVRGQTNMAAIATVVDLFVYPVKSARGIGRSRVRVAATGFEWDRQWMLVDGKGTFLSQRTHPQLARIVPEITGDALVLTSEGVPPLRVPLGQRGERVAVRVWRDACTGIDQGAPARAWASRLIGEDVRLVRVAPDMARSANVKFAHPTPAPLAFPDGYPLLVCNQASLEDLNGRLTEAITIERFRPNIVVAGLEPWAEDRIDTLIVGAVTLRLVKPCTRCSIPSRDPLTGDASTDPVPVLRKFRFDRSLRGVTFGENAVIAAGAGSEIERGSPCRVT